MDAISNRRNRMRILKRKRQLGDLPIYSRRKISRRAVQPTTSTAPQTFATNQSNKKRRFQNSITETGSSSRSVPRQKSPMVNQQTQETLTTNTPMETEDRGENADNLRAQLTGAHKRTVYEVWDFGPPDRECPHCHAILWYEERTVKSKRPRDPKFSLCCSEGKVTLPLLKEAPPFLRNLLDYNGGRDARLFRQSIRVYNSMFAFTSSGGKVDNTVNDGHGPYVYRINGQNHHRFGSLIPPDGQRPRFLQLYIHDTDNEVQNRMRAIQSNDASGGIDANVVSGLLRMLDQYNPLVKVFRMARDRFRESDFRPVKIRLIGRRRGDGPQYNLPTSSEVAALIVGSENPQCDGRDVIVEQYRVGLRRITEIHPSFMAMQYPLLFPYGDDFYRTDIEYVNNEGSTIRKRQYVSFREAFAFRLMQREREGQTLLRGGRLFQQFCCDAFTAMEAGRLRWVERNQNQLRAALYNGLMDAVVRGDTAPASVGVRYILPSSFTGSPRYMIQNYQDAMAICRWVGTPDIFITFTCNSRWREFQYMLDRFPGQKVEDRHELITRVFKIKLDALMDDLRKGEHFGKAEAAIYTIEFQKRGLPHAHILLFLKPEAKRQLPADIDEIISAQLPNRVTDPVGYDAVVQYMVHGPCGAYNVDCPCMENGDCTKHYPKSFCSETTVNKDGFPIYKRRNDGRVAMKNSVELDNRWVVPHNVDLVVKYDAHINVEHCNQGRSIKYLFKYINKGHDRATFHIEDNLTDNGDNTTPTVTEVNEISRYKEGRYVSGSESTWRAFGFDVHYRDIGVERLNFHLPDEQTIIFRDNQYLVDVVNRENIHRTKFTEWMTANRLYEDARELTYPNFPTRWTWKNDIKQWTRRKGGRMIGRMYFVHPSAGERYYLRMLLNIVKGPTSFEDIRTVDGLVYPTFKEACSALGLLDNDEEWHQVLSEASQWASANQLRLLFVTIIFFCEVSDHRSLWLNNWEILSDDIIYRASRSQGVEERTLSPEQIQSYALYEIEQIMNRNGRSLRDFKSLPFPNLSLIQLTRNRLLMDELSYDRDVCSVEYSTLYSGLNEDQKAVYNSVLDAATSDNGGFFFVYGSGGTGKTYLWKTIISKLRSEGKIVLAVASSGIASLLLPGGRTTHSRFKLPLKLDESSCCSINQGTNLAELICKAHLIIWDEAPMAHRNAFEALDRTLRDILRFTNTDALNRPFGGKTIVLGGDFRQILPVVPKGGRQDIVAASVSESYLWEHCHIFKLTINMRLHNSDMDTSLVEEISDFSKWVLDVGDGKLSAHAFDYDEEPRWVKIPEDIFLESTANPIEQIVQWTYPNFKQRHKDRTYLKARAILAPTNDDVDTVNDYMQTWIQGESRVYYSFDKLDVESGSVEEQSILYPTEFLNTLNFTGIPKHQLKLKVGVPVILLRNINPSEGLCNGTRLIVQKLGSKVIEAEIITGSERNIGKRVLIHRIIMSPNDTKWPFKLQRRQFPLKLCFAMTINKSQGQTFDHLGVYLPRPVFSHGQLYVAVSRVTSRSGLKILAVETDDERKGYTKNIVYHEIFEKLP